ncbi:MAG: hypothetical protein ACI8UO_003500 [Verrucomicrobiales bacterium]|jgi:hypothetical protein
MWEVSLVLSFVFCGSGFAQLVHDGQLLDRGRADLVSRKGPAALDPFRSPLDSLELEASPSTELNEALEIGDAIDLRPLFEARSIPLSAESVVGFSPSLSAAFYRANWEEAELIKAFLADGQAGSGERFFVDSETWIFQVPVMQMKLDDWRRPLTLSDLELAPDAELIRYERIGVQGGNRFGVETRGEAPRTELEWREADEFWGVAHSQRAQDSWENSSSIAKNYRRPNSLVWYGRSNGRAGGLESFEWNQRLECQFRPGSTAVFNLGFRRKPEPRRFVMVTRIGAGKPEASKQQRGAIRRWRELGQVLPESSELVGAELAVIRIPGNLLEFVDPAGGGYPPGYDANRPYARSGVHPEIFGDQELRDFGPFLQRGGAKFPPGSEAWFLEKDQALFLRVLPEDLAAIEFFLKQVAEHEHDPFWALDVGAWIGVTPDQQPTPDWAATTLSDGEIGVGAGADSSWLDDARLAEIFSSFNVSESTREGLNIRSGFFGPEQKTAVHIHAKFPHRQTNKAMAFRYDDRDFQLEDGGMKEITLDDLAGSSQQLLIRIHSRRVSEDGGPIRTDDDPKMRRWRARWQAVFE